MYRAEQRYKKKANRTPVTLTEFILNAEILDFFFLLIRMYLYSAISYKSAVNGKKK